MEHFTLRPVIWGILTFTISMVANAQQKPQPGVPDFKFFTSHSVNPAQKTPISPGKPTQKIKKLSGNCAPDTVILTNQDEIDNFPTLYPDCHVFKNILIQGGGDDSTITNLDSLSQVEEILDRIEITGTKLTSLSGLSGLKKVGIWFVITHNPLMEETGLTGLESLGIIYISNMPALTSIAGLTNNLTNHGTYTLIINDTKLTDLSGLEGIHSVPNMYISGNFDLISLKGLENLTESGGGISIAANILLEDITQLSGITSVGFGPLEIMYNYALQNLDGLENISFVKKHLWLHTNITLQNMEALNDNLLIEDEDTGKLKIIDNFQLSFCSEPSVCTFLQNGGAYEISGNATGCQDFATIEAACLIGCSGGEHLVFTGDDNDDWHNPSNWNLSKIPGACDTAEIPSGKSVNLSGNVIVGTLLAGVATIESNDHNIRVQRGAGMDGTTINHANTFQINCIDETQVTNCNISAIVKLFQVQKGLVFSWNNIYTSNFGLVNLEIKDIPERTGDIILNSNYIEGDFSLNIKTTDGNANTLVAQDEDMEVKGSVIIKAINRGGEFRMGKLYQGRVNIRNNLTLDAGETDYPMLSKIRFYGDEPSEIIKSGTAALEFEEIYFEKDWKNIHTTFSEDITITDRANFYIGLAKPLGGKKMIFGSNSFVSVYSSASWVSGTIRKIGNTSFTFPVGNDNQQGVIGIFPAESVGIDVALDATYYPTNPTASGYDTALHETSLHKVSGSEFWRLEQVAGDPIGNKKVLLRYDSLYSQKTNFKSDLRIAAWDGTQWLNKGVTEVNGTDAEAYPLSDVFSSDQTVFTLGYIPSRLPVVTVGPIPASPCKSQNFKVPLDLDTIMVGGNTFQVQLSNAEGNFSTYTIIGQLTNVTQSDTILASLPFSIPTGQSRLIRIVGISPAIVSVNTRSLTAAGVPELPITIAGPDKVCLNSGAAKYYVQTPEPGAIYNWSVTTGAGTVVPNHDTAYITWTSAGPFRVVLVTSSNQCGIGQNAQKLNILVANPAPVSAPVLSNTGRWINASLPAPPQPGIGIRWFRNGIEIPAITAYAYYAGAAGIYTAAYFSNCSDGPISNPITFTANALPQQINFEPVPDKVFGDLPFQLNATSTAGLPVQFSIINGPGSIIGNTYNITGLGNVTIRATQQGNNEYDTAAWTTRSFTVNKASQFITFDTITGKTYGGSSFSISPVASSGLPCQVNIVSGPATLTGNMVTLTGAGVVTIRAIQAGNGNYNAAQPVERSFCVTPGNLNGINGPVSTCPAKPVIYTTKSIPNAVYTWQVAGGAILPSTTNQVTVTWPAPGSYSLIVQVQGPCGDATIPDTLKVLAITSLEPDSVSNMLPANGTTGLKLPLNLSWVPRHPGLQYFYDLYIWRANEPQPATPFASNISTVNYSIPVNSGLLPTHLYKWMVVAWNGSCTRIQTGPIQEFTLAPLADLQVTSVSAPVSAFSGQPISIEWTVKNNGPGKTELNESWTDAVFLSFDTMPFFNNIANNPAAWNQLEFPVRPLMIGTKPNVSALDAGASYTNNITFIPPPDYNWTVYAYVITNFAPGPSAPRESTYANDTAKAANGIAITLSPAPDLRVDSVITATPVFSGSTVTVRYKVKNYGTKIGTTAPNTFNDKVYISKSPFFNISTAHLLKQPKPNGTYYSTIIGQPAPAGTPANDYYQNSAPDAAWTKTGPLENDSSYVRDVQVVLPNFISGEHYLFVVTDADNQIYEGPAEQNNTASFLTSVILSPTPQLIVSDLQIPFSNASTTQNFGVNWTITNTGSFDNLQRNAGHHLVLTNQPCLLNATTPGLLAKDSISYGNSYWIDRIYLSTEPGGLNPANARLLHTYYNGSRHIYNIDYLSPFVPLIPNSTGNCISPLVSLKQFSKNVDHVLNPGAVFPGQYSFKVPTDILPGTYYLYVATNADSAIFESPYSLKWRRSAPIVINRPDLRVGTVLLPANVTGGQAFNIGYTIENIGTGSIFGAGRTDEIYVSNEAVFNATAKKIAALQYTEDLAAGATISKTFSYTIGAEAAGTRYFFVRTNTDSSTIKETNYANNLGSSSLSYSPGISSDLMITGIDLADSVFSVYGFPMKYMVSNNGSGTTYGTWTDSIFISCQPVFNRSTSFYAGNRKQTRVLANGASYTDSFQLIVPLTYLINSCFAGINMANAYFHIITNSDAGTYETNRGNNTSATPVKIVINPNVDHIVTGITMPDEVLAGQTFTANWNVKNIGYNPGGNLYISWQDQWYFQLDSTEAGTGVNASAFNQNNRLSRNESFTYQRQVQTPNIPSGEYYVKITTNANKQIIAEAELGNNSQFVRSGDGRAKKIKVVAPVPADLTGSFGNYPASIVAGQSFTLPFNLANNGPGAAVPGAFSNSFVLSNNFNPNSAGFIYLGNSYNNGVLNPGGAYTGSMVIQIPINIVPGNYILIMDVNSQRSVFENQLNNNLVFGYITITAPTLTDFTVQQVKTSDTALLGYPLPIKWQVGNLSANNAGGFGTDGIYLSSTTSADSAVLQGTLFHPFNIAALGLDSFTHSPVIQGVTEGEYNLLVKADILNNFNDPNRANNTGVRSPKLYVDVKKIQLGQLESNNLKERTLYYKLFVPDSLEGSTLLLTLKTPDSLGAVNQVFAGHKFIPTPARFDYAYETPNAGNQTMMMTSVKAGNYYLAIQTSTPNRPVQAITLKVEILPFAIVKVDAGSGGNTGNVTIRITGSLFTPDMVARLKGPATITASRIYFTNSNQVFATFNLLGAPLGVYNVELFKPANSTTAMLENGFRVEKTNNGGLITGPGSNTGQSGNGNDPGCSPGAQSGLNAQLVVKVTIPPKVFGGWPFVIQINYTNPTNVDIPVQTRVVFNEEGMPVALTSGALDGSATANLYVELSETNGPPGFIRAGGSGTINVYSKAPADYPGHSILHYILR